MDFDFKGGGGFVVARRALSRPMPEEYAVTFRLRGRGAPNNLELKLVDATGQNVWRHVHKDLQPPARWKRMRVDSRDIEFAWGPSSGGRISGARHAWSSPSSRVRAARAPVWIADVEIEDCTPRAPQAALERMPDFERRRCPARLEARPMIASWIAIDSMEPRTIGGLIIDWPRTAPASGFRVRGSNSGLRWKTLYSAETAGGKRSYVYLPGLKTRFLRLEAR